MRYLLIKSGEIIYIKLDIIQSTLNIISSYIPAGEVRQDAGGKA